MRRKVLAEGRAGKYLKYAIGEIILVVLGILIALSMLFSLFVGLGSSGRSTSGNAPLPESERFEAPAEPVGALDGQVAPVAMISQSTTGPPAAS